MVKNSLLYQREFGEADGEELPILPPPGSLQLQERSQADLCKEKVTNKKLKFFFKIVTSVKVNKTIFDY